MKRILVLMILLSVALAGPLLASSEVIIDNTSTTTTGGWSSGASPTDKYGTNYLYATIATGGGKTATYTPDLAYTTNDWEVFVWYPTFVKQTTAAQVVVHHNGVDTTIYINQSLNPGNWVSLGKYTMNAGTANFVRISNTGSDTTKTVAADAVRFYSATAGDVTPPVITSIISNPSSTSAVITWITDEPATSQVEYGPTASYGYQTSNDTNLVTSHSVVVSGLTTTTPYHFRVKSADIYNNLRTSSDRTFTTTAVIPEYRTMWINSWGTGTDGDVLSASHITTLVNELHRANYNAMVAEVRKSGDAFYDSAYEPRASNILDPDPFDPLQDMITKAHAVGMEVHAWMVTYRVWDSKWSAPPSTHIWAKHPDWAMKTSSGAKLDGDYYNLDPGVPGVQDYLAKVVVDLISHYDVDGVNFDYIRYPGTDWGYNEITKARFLAEYGYNPPISTTDPNWGVWSDYRRQQVTDLVKKIYLEVMWHKPMVKMSVDSVGWLGGNPVNDFTGTRQYYEAFQDSDKWARDHIIDFNLLMNYKREYDSAQAPDYDLWTDWLQKLQTVYGRIGVDGGGAYLNSITDNIHQMQVARDHGVGIGNYDYLSTNKDGQATVTFVDAVQNQIYTSPAPVPDMPWKSNPTTGIIFGTVTNAAQPNDPVYQNWVYKATVTATNSTTQATQTTLTDATGTYGFIDLPVGSYSISVAKTGFPTRTYTAQVIKAGDVLREDFDLGYVTISSPAGAVVPDYSWISLPLDPVNPAPTAVLPGIRLDGYLYRWDEATQSQYTYDDWAPYLLGDLKMGDGYSLFTEAPYTISYQAYSGSPATRDIALPTVGWAFFGCPFTRNVDWSKASVTRNGETVDLRTAAKDKRWLSSTAFWWNPVEQSEYDTALLEDWPTGGTELQPWHAYWMETWADGLTLTLR